MKFSKKSQEKINAVMEFEESNKSHRKIGMDDWIEYRPKVPKHIPEEQITRYIFKLIKKTKKKEKFFSLYGEY